MARLAAAAGLACATLLLCVALGAGQPQSQANLASWFPSGSLPPPVRIYSKRNDSLNVAVRDGNVVFATADCKDNSQKWYPLYTSGGSFSGRQPFSLLNAKTFQVMKIPSGRGKVGVSGPDDSARAAREELWTPEKPTRADGFFQLFVTRNTALTLNGLMGVRSGSEVWIASASPKSLNALWKITSYPPCLP